MSSLGSSLDLPSRRSRGTQQVLPTSQSLAQRDRLSATITKNLKNYQPDYKTIIPEIRIGYGRRRKAMKDIVLCIDQSGSMGASVVYSGIFGSVLASIPRRQYPYGRLRHRGSGSHG